MVIAGLTNTYSSYVTTWEEYQVRNVSLTELPSASRAVCTSRDAQRGSDVQAT